MSLEIWQEIPAVNLDDARPIIDTVSDFDLTNKVIEGLSLEQAGFTFELAALCRSFKDGRIVKTNPLKPLEIHKRVKELDEEELLESERWFTTSSYILRLVGGRSTGCYGFERTSYGLIVFGQ
jgi:hypothetical protein